MQTCIQCGFIKNPSEFYNKHSRCKDCISLNAKNPKNKAKRNTYRRSYSTYKVDVVDFRKIIRDSAIEKLQIVCKKNKLELIESTHYVTASHKIQFKCYCNKVFLCAPMCIIANKTRSCGCIRRAKLEKELITLCEKIDLKIQTLNFTTGHGFVSAHKHKFICKCGNIFISTLKNIRMSRTNCGCEKTCSRCFVLKPDINFKKRGTICSECQTLLHRQYYHNNKEKQSYKNKKYRELNSDTIKKKKKKNRQNRIEEIRVYEQEKYANDIQFVLRKRLRSRLNAAIKNKQKAGSAVKDLGCTIPELVIYLESKFINGMSWNNREKWHLDHIIPLSLFDLTDREQFIKACHYTNLQPLWAIDNIKKGAKMNHVDSNLI